MTFWFDSFADFSRPVAAVLAAYVGVILLTRLFGLRSFAKMSSFDFAATIATGSLMASTALSSMPIASGLAAIAALYMFQGITGWIRRRFEPAEQAIDNSPVLLMDGTVILHENLKSVSVTEGDLFGKLREANVLDLNDVRAVVMECTGDISVLHSANPDKELSAEVMRFVGPVPARRSPEN